MVDGATTQEGQNVQSTAQEGLSHDPEDRYVAEEDEGHRCALNAIAFPRVQLQSGSVWCAQCLSVVCKAALRGWQTPSASCAGRKRMVRKVITMEMRRWQRLWKISLNKPSFGRF